MKRALVLILALLCIMSLAGCKGKPKVLLDTDVLKVEQEGGKITITDVLNDESYTFILKHTKPLEGDVEPIRVISNEHIVIDKYPKRLLITDLTAKRSYTISISILRVKVNSTGQFEEIKDREVTQ